MPQWWGTQWENIMRRLAPRLLSGFCACILASGFYAQMVSAAVDVIVQPVSSTSLNTRIEALGTLRANESITLTPNVTKTVTRLNFDDGQRVTAGQVLVEMTSREESALLEEARFHTEEAKKQLDRVASLVARGAASQSLLDQRVREYEAARARYNATESRLKDLILVAPFSGVLGLRNVSVGALVSPGDHITTLNDDSKMKLDFTVPAVYLRYLAVGLPVIAKSPDLGEQLFHGKVVSIDNQIDEVTRAIRVRALIDNPDFQLKQGMLMLVDLNAAPREALVISESALVPLGSHNFVFVVSEGEKGPVVERRQIVIGERLAGAVEVLAGLTSAEKLITHGLQKVRDGQLVNVRAEEPPVAERLGETSPLADLLSQKSR